MFIQFKICKLKWKKSYLKLEALYVQELEAEMNTNDEYQSRTLTMKI